jgi:hypothetical protein
LSCVFETCAIYLLDEYVFIVNVVVVVVVVNDVAEEDTPLGNHNIVVAVAVAVVA